MTRVKAITHDGSSHILVLPPDLDPYRFLCMLVEREGTMSESTLEPWLDTRSGGRIRTDEIRDAYVLVGGDDGLSMAQKVRL